MKPERRRLLVDVAAREFAVAGYEQASLNRIIKGCGLSKSSFYHHVASKEALFGLVLDDIGRTLLEAAQIPTPESLAGRHFWDELEQLVLRLARSTQQDERFAQVGRMFYLPGAPRDRNDPLAEAETAIEGWLTAVLEVGRECGAVRSDLPTALQDRLTIGVLRAFDEWALQLPTTADYDLMALTTTQFQLLRRMLSF